MRANPVLGELSLGDLNQRYEQSYVVYKGIPMYVQGFVGGRPNNIVAESIYRETREEQRISITESFNWRELDVERPNAGWYMVDTFEGVRPVYLAYPIRRQWKRGLCPRNTILLSPFTEIPKGEAFYSILSRNTGIMASPLTMEELLETEGTFIPRPNVLLTKVGKEVSLYLGTEKVAVIEPKKKIIRRLDWLDDIEVKEVLWAPDFDIVPIPNFSKPGKLFSVHGNRQAVRRNPVAQRLAEIFDEPPPPPRDEDEFDMEAVRDDHRQAARVLSSSLLSVYDRNGDIVNTQNVADTMRESLDFVKELFYCHRTVDWFVPDGRGLISDDLRCHDINEGGIWTIARDERYTGVLMDIRWLPILQDNLQGLMALHKIYFPYERPQEPAMLPLYKDNGALDAVIITEFVPRNDKIRYSCHLYWNSLGDF